MHNLSPSKLIYNIETCRSIKKIIETIKKQSRVTSTLGITDFYRKYHIIFRIYSYKIFTTFSHIFYSNCGKI